MVSRCRLGREHIQRGACDLAASQGGNRIRLDNDAARLVSIENAVRNGGSSADGVIALRRINVSAASAQVMSGVTPAQCNSISCPSALAQPSRLESELVALLLGVDLGEEDVGGAGHSQRSVVQLRQEARRIRVCRHHSAQVSML